MAYRMAARASEKLDLTGVLLHRKGRDAARKAEKKAVRDLRPFYAGVLVWAGVFGLIWLLD